MFFSSWPGVSLCSVCPDQSFSKAAMWWARLVDQTVPVDSSGPTSLFLSLEIHSVLLWRWLTFTPVCGRLYLCSWQLFFCFGTAARTRSQISESWDNTVQLWGLVEGRAAGLKSTPVHCFLKCTACLSCPQRVPSWFSSVQSVITVSGRLLCSMCISQHSQCFPCVVSFLLCSNGLKLCALQKEMKTLHNCFDIQFNVFTVLSVSEAKLMFLKGPALANSSEKLSRFRFEMDLSFQQNWQETNLSDE